ncbi:MAG: hypothetical protein IID32_06770, partial [Planctomycetes bacterium]|nr:hypothetical protein [Planctomycetota bacterium]
MVAAQVTMAQKVSAQAESTDEVIVVSGESASVTNVEEPDAAGVIPSISHQGDILDLLRLLSAATHKNIIPSREVRGIVTVNLYDVTYEEVLDVVLTANDFAYEERDSFIFVYTKQEYEQMRAASRRMETQVFRINYVSASDMQNMISPLLSENSKITTSPSSGGTAAGTGDQWASGNYLIILDYPENLEQITELIAELDQRPAQVLV